MGNGTVVITRVVEGRQWHALEDDEVVGRGHALSRPDGRVFVSIDSWHAAVFHELAGVMLGDLPAPLWTVVDEADSDQLRAWQRVGFVARRREWEYVMATDPGVTGLGGRLGAGHGPEGLRIVPAGQAEEGLLGELYRQVRAEVEATVGWQSMPVEVLPRLDEGVPLHPERYAVAVLGERYVGLARVAPLPRRPRIGLIAVREELRRRGVARALLGHVLGLMYEGGIGAASAEVDEGNRAAVHLVEGIGGRRVSSAVEMVWGG